MDEILFQDVELACFAQCFDVTLHITKLSLALGCNSHDKEQVTLIREENNTKTLLI